MKKKSYFWDKVFPVILTALFAFIGTWYWKNKEIGNLKQELTNLENQMPKMPVTVVDPATKNQLYIGTPIPRSTHYEFPIILNDGKGVYRIDHYALENRFKGKLVVIPVNSKSSKVTIKNSVAYNNAGGGFVVNGSDVEMGGNFAIDNEGKGFGVKGDNFNLENNVAIGNEKEGFDIEQK